MKYKPTKEECEECIRNGMSLTQIGDKYHWSTKTISDLFKLYKLERPNVGRPRGYQVSEETRKKMSESIREAKQ